MPCITLSTLIAAPIERAFDLARSIDLHTATVSSTGEKAIAGVVTGLIGLGEEVTWSARHLGIRQTLSIRITQFERPFSFTDTMLHGAFRRMEHHHLFESTHDGVLMRDVFLYESPLGLLGRIADAFFLEAYMRAFLIGRNRILKATAESDAWQRYLPAGD